MLVHAEKERQTGASANSH